jgi:hypothetical protein
MALEDVMDERRKAMEEAFFRKRDEKLLQELRAKQQKLDARQKLADIGITDEAVLDRLIDFGISPATLAALTLILVGGVGRRQGRRGERAPCSVRRRRPARRRLGGHAMLQSWLATRPDLSPSAWELRGPARNSPQQRSRLDEEVLGRARRVAEATGGLLGIGRKSSRAEEAVLAKLATAIKC